MKKMALLGVIALIPFNLVILGVFIKLSPANPDNESFVVPDPIFINEECEKLGILTREYRDLNLSANKLCNDYKKRRINGDQWLEKENEIKQNLRQLLATAPNTSDAAYAPLGSSDASVHSIGDTSVPSTGTCDSNSPVSCKKDRTSEASSADNPKIALFLDIPATKLVSIPKGYAVYTIFLVPSDEWLSKTKSEQLQSLHNDFYKFGDEIGDRKAAIWFSDKSRKSVDTKRSKYYCDKFNLDYNDGPYIVATSLLPDEVDANHGNEIFVIKLSHIPSDKVISLLNILEQDLRKIDLLGRGIYYLKNLR